MLRRRRCLLLVWVADGIDGVLYRVVEFNAGLEMPRLGYWKVAVQYVTVKTSV